MVSLTSCFSRLESWKPLLWPNEMIPFPISSTMNEVNQGNHDRTPYLRINNTYTSGLKTNITSPVRNKPPEIPFSDKKVERLGT